MKDRRSSVVSLETTVGGSKAEVTVGDQDVARFLDEQLESIYGGSFTKVIEYEFQTELRADLFNALRTNPAEAMAILCRIFRWEKTVALIFSTLTERLRTLDSRHETQELLAVLDPIMPARPGSDP